METGLDPIDALFDVDLALRFLAKKCSDEYVQVLLEMVRKEHRKAILELNERGYVPSKVG
ncbi:hypothetical protein [Pseudodesulfovibrio sediminis]|uniref:Uncharacterized protein n=1 Tax=Pseudodesulfovibrio sediminis TaxID=2810563 RepID=A0ABM7P3D2_9BACT|nr:hypothetical protein [Pseudodesulfovibrio sediminis]BCS87352.1 hypothetical protein PSDVSF_05940 [Pseudodesulfovibrio sediminis]